MLSKKVTSNRVLITSFLVDLSDVLINVTIAVISGSVTMIAQALEGGADLLASGLLLWGAKRSRLPADEKHPYGYGSEMYLWAMLSGIVIFAITSTLSIYLGFERLIEPQEISDLPLTYIALIISIFSNGYAFSLSYRKIMGNKKSSNILEAFNNSALIEIKTSFIQDLMGTVASLLGLIAMVIYGYTGNLDFDALGSIFTGASLLFFSYFIMKGAKELLIGRSASPDIIKVIRKDIESFGEINSILDLRTMLLGPRKILINLGINVKDDFTTNELEILIDRIEDKIKTSLPDRETFIQVELENS